MNAPAAQTQNKKNGCLKGCLVVILLVTVAVAVAGFFLYSRRDRIAGRIRDRLTGGGIEVEAPANFRSVPLPLGLAAPGVRSSGFFGKGALEETRDAFVRSLEANGWTRVQDGDAHAEAFSFVFPGEGEGEAAGMTMDFFRREKEILMLYVAGADEGTFASLVAMPEDSVLSRETPRAPR